MFSNGSIVVQFGDTFCHNVEGDFVGFDRLYLCIGVRRPQPNFVNIRFYGYKGRGRKGRARRGQGGKDEKKEEGSRDNQSSSYIARFKDTEGIKKNRPSTNLERLGFERNSSNGGTSEIPIPPFIERFKDEVNTEDKIHRFWSFGGIIEYGSPERGFFYGWTWFQLLAILPKANNHKVFHYTGIAKVASGYDRAALIFLTKRKELPVDC